MRPQAIYIVRLLPFFFFFFVGAEDLLFPIGISHQYRSDYSNLQADLTHRVLQSFPCRLLMTNIFPDIGERKTLFNPGGECLIFSDKRTFLTFLFPSIPSMVQREPEMRVTMYQTTFGSSGNQNSPSYFVHF